MDELKLAAFYRPDHVTLLDLAAAQKAGTRGWDLLVRRYEQDDFSVPSIVRRLYMILLLLVHARQAHPQEQALAGLYLIAREHGLKHPVMQRLLRRDVDRVLEREFR